MFSHALMETLLISSISSSEHLKEQCHGFLEQNNEELVWWNLLENTFTHDKRTGPRHIFQVYT